MITPATVPPVPGKPTGTAGHQSVALSWTSGGDGGSSIASWQYQKKSTDNYGSWTDICKTSTTPACPTKTSHTVTGTDEWYGVPVQDSRGQQCGQRQRIAGIGCDHAGCYGAVQAHADGGGGLG